MMHTIAGLLHSSTLYFERSDPRGSSACLHKRHGSKHSGRSLTCTILKKIALVQVNKYDAKQCNRVIEQRDISF